VDAVAGDGLVERLAGGDKMLLSNEFPQRFWADAVCKRLGGAVFGHEKTCDGSCYDAA
jgi:hypothetical protein